MDEAAVRRMLKDQIDAIYDELYTQLAELQVELQGIKSLGLNRHGAGGDPGLSRSMRLEKGTPPNGSGECHAINCLPTGTVSKPTTLGDAFSLARITEARLGDQGVSSVSNTTIVNSGEGHNQKGATSRVTFPRHELVKSALSVAPPKPTSNSDEDADADQDNPEEQGDALESEDISILTYLVGHESPRSLQLWGTIGSGNIHMLIDNGSTHSFVQMSVVERMKLAVSITKPFKVYIESGETLLCENICSKVGINMQGLAVETMEFILEGVAHTLQGDASLWIKPTSLHNMQALLDTYGIYEMYELHGVQGMEDGTEVQQVTNTITHLEIDQLITRLSHSFRDDIFFKNKNDDAHEHVERVLDIVSLFNIPGVSHDAVMLLVFPITLTGAAKRWVDRLPPGTIDSWDLFKKAFLQRYCPPSKTSKQEVNIFYNGLGTMNRQLLDLQGPISGMTPTQALTAIQTMADHSQKWQDGTSNRNIKGSSNSEGIAASVNKLENLGRDMKKLKKNVYAIQIGYQICRGAHLDKDCPLNEEVKSVEEVRYGEFGRPFLNYSRNGKKFNRYDQPSSKERRTSLTEIINKYMEEASKRHVEQDEWLKKFYQSIETSREAPDKIIQGLETKVKILANEVEGRVNNGKFEECKTICIEDGSPLYTPFNYSLEEIEYFSSNS
uniref:Retrotransposon gag domain-containing protein n=1 Tax=Tanacetum cinerariifolium TaxID=118510 RepID=A0A6L2MI57_TANCI|nr:hypothetical protein [Tanacetum cinerariifolium]